MKTFEFIATNNLDNQTRIIRIKASNPENALNRARFEAIANNGFSAFGLSIIPVPEMHFNTPHLVGC